MMQCVDPPLMEGSTEAVSKIQRPFESKKVTWGIEGANVADNWQIIRGEAKLRIKFGEDTDKTVIQFGFGDYVTKEYQQDTHYYAWKNYLSLEATLFPNGKNSIKTFEVEVFYTSDKTAPPKVIIPKTIVHFSQSVVKVKPDFLHTTTQCYSTDNVTPVGSEYPCSYGPKIFLVIVVNPVVCPTQILGGLRPTQNIPVLPTSEEKSSLSANLGDYYSNVEDNYSDLRLESRDGMTLKAHRFILGARSKIFHDLLERQCKSNDFDGCMKIDDVDAKPLRVILNWMYTGKLEEETDKFLEDLVNAAIKYELVEMLKLLDGQLVKICNSDNMLRLFQLAKQNGMEAASKHVAEFIRKNIN